MIKFTCFGHKNILGTHKTTLEFTKDKEVTKKGNCIIGVNSDFDSEEIKEYIKDKKKIKIIIKVNNLEEEINAETNPDFDSEEIVVRKGDFLSERTLGINADKAASDLNKDLIELMKNPKNKTEVIIK